MEALEVIRVCARIAAEKRASDLLVLSTGRVSDVADYFLLATARNKRQMKAIIDTIKLELKALGVHSLHTEGQGSERWVLLDYGFVVIHVFDAETRSYYDLESLWADAPRVDVKGLLEDKDGRDLLSA